MDIKRIRMDLHQIPELGRCEVKTKDYIMKFLRTYSCTVYEPTSTGVVAYIDAGRKKTICFRADMDGLKILEKTEVAYTSRHPGVMHACGHDGHMAMLLGFIAWACEHKSVLHKNIVCLFQPSEEEGAGALDILSSGILEQLQVEEMYGIHLWPMLKTNQLYTMPAAMLASSSEVNVEFFGKSAHAANRQEGIDALRISTEFLRECYEEFSKLTEPHLLSFGTLKAGGVRNAVADYARLEGTMRCYTDDVFVKMKNILLELIQKYEDLYKVKILLQANDLYKSVINSKELIDEYRETLSLESLAEPFLQAEDFGCYTRRYKSMFLLLGIGDAHLLHTDNFDFDMNILDTGVEAYKRIAIK